MRRRPRRPGRMRAKVAGVGSARGEILNVVLEVSIGTLARLRARRLRRVVAGTGRYRGANVGHPRAAERSLATLVLAGCGAAGSAAKRVAEQEPHAARRPAPSTAPPAHQPGPTTRSSRPPSRRRPTHGDRPGDRDRQRSHARRQQVALTFHGNGDPALAEALLRAVEAKGAKITVFAVGNWLAANPALGRRILSGGPRAREPHLHPP